MERWEYLRLVICSNQSRKPIRYNDYYTHVVCQYDQISRTYNEICSDGWKLMGIAIYGEEEIHTFEKRLEPQLPKAPTLEI